ARTSLRAPREDITQPTGSARHISKLIATASWRVTMKAIATGRGISPGASSPDIRKRVFNYLEGRGRRMAAAFFVCAALPHSILSIACDATHDIVPSAEWPGNKIRIFLGSV